MQNLDKWRQDPDYKFPYGLGRLRHAFGHLYDSDLGAPKIGFEKPASLKTGNSGCRETIRRHLEAELWFRGSASRREQAESYVQGIIRSQEAKYDSV